MPHFPGESVFAPPGKLSSADNSAISRPDSGSPAPDPAFTKEDNAIMLRCLELARHAARVGEVPVGACVVLGDDIIGEGFNQSISARDPSAHAEIIALRAAAQRLDNYRLTGARLYVTLESCAMCAGALIWARISELIFAAPDPRSGAVQSAIRLLEVPSLNHRTRVRGGLLETQSAGLLRDFFRDRRANQSALQA